MVHRSRLRPVFDAGRGAIGRELFLPRRPLVTLHAQRFVQEEDKLSWWRVTLPWPDCGSLRRQPEEVEEGM
jgi:hypothetical protein